MKTRFMWIWITIVLMLISGMRGKVSASPETKISIDPSQVKDVPTGETFSVGIVITDVTNLYGWQINITFDPSVLNVATVSEGPFLKSVNNTAWPTPKIDNDKGYVLASSSFMPPYPSQGVDGSGILGNITLTVKSGGSTTLHLAGGTKLRTVQEGTVIPIENFTTQDCAFGSGGVGGLSFELIAGVTVVIAVSVVAGALYLKRRKT